MTAPVQVGNTGAAVWLCVDGARWALLTVEQAREVAVALDQAAYRALGERWLIVAEHTRAKDKEPAV